MFKTLDINVDDVQLNKTVEAQTLETYRKVIKNDVVTSRTMRKGKVGTGMKELPHKMQEVPFQLL